MIDQVIDAPSAVAEVTTTLDESISLRRQLRIFEEVATALSSAHELPHLLKIILTGATAGQGLGFNRAFLFLYSPDTGCLHGDLAVGPSSAEEAGRVWQDLADHRTDLAELLDAHERTDSRRGDAITSLVSGFTIDLQTESALAEACRHGRGFVLSEIHAKDGAAIALAKRLGTAEVAMVPLVSKQRLQGLIAADNVITGQPIDADAFGLLQVLAHQAAVAMERGRLYEVQRERTVALEQMNRLLAESRDQIIRNEKMSVIGELTAAVAHELRNPLTIVGGFANLMLKAGVTDEHREYLSIISSEARRAETVLEEVLDYWRASKMLPHILDFSILAGRAVSAVVGRRPDARIRFESTGHAPGRVLGNNDQLSHALYQFLNVISDELAPACALGVRCDCRSDVISLHIEPECDQADRSRAVSALRRVFGDGGTAKRLQVMVASETIKGHGGSLELGLSADTNPHLTIELPAATESNHG